MFWVFSGWGSIIFVGEHKEQMMGSGANMTLLLLLLPMPEHGVGGGGKGDGAGSFVGDLGRGCNGDVDFGDEPGDERSGKPKIFAGDWGRGGTGE